MTVFFKMTYFSGDAHCKKRKKTKNIDKRRPRPRVRVLLTPYYPGAEKHAKGRASRPQDFGLSERGTTRKSCLFASSDWPKLRYHLLITR